MARACFILESDSGVWGGGDCCCCCSGRVGSWCRSSSSTRRYWTISSFLSIATCVMASRQREARFMFSMVRRVTVLVSSLCRTLNSLYRTYIIYTESETEPEGNR